MLAVATLLTLFATATVIPQGNAKRRESCLFFLLKVHKVERLFSQRMLYCEGEVHCALYIIIDFGLSCYIASVACQIH